MMMIRVKISLLLFFSVLFIEKSLSQNRILSCEGLAQKWKMDSLLMDFLGTLPKLTKGEFNCLGEWYAQKDIRKGVFRILDSSKKPNYQINGYSICELDDLGYDFIPISDYNYSPKDLEMVNFYIEAYNKLMFQELASKTEGAHIYKIINAPPIVDPYSLRQRLSRILQRPRLIKLTELEEDKIHVRIDLAKLFSGIKIKLKQLSLIIIDENERGSRLTLPFQDVKRLGFTLTTTPSRTLSNYKYDFKIRIDYSQLISNEKMVSCEKVENYYYHFIPLTITRDHRLITHRN